MKRFFSIFFVFLLLALCSFPCFAETYSTDFPSYVPISGGAFFEVKSSFGQITFVCPNTFKSGYFGFNGSGSNICNISNSTISGYIYTSSGASYSARFTSLGGLEYRTSSSSYDWVGITITDILNTNVTFIDDKLDRQTDNYFFSKEQIFYYSILCIIGACCVLGLFFRKKRGS